MSGPVAENFRSLTKQIKQLRTAAEDYLERVSVDKSLERCFQIWPFALLHMHMPRNAHFLRANLLSPFLSYE